MGAMTPVKFLAAAAVGLSAGACSYSNTTTAAAPPAPVMVPAGTVVTTTGSQQACMDYGFTPGTASFDRCVRLDADARARGRASVTYSQASLAADAQMACSSYGLSAGTMNYDRCVSREIDARRYVAVTTYTTPTPVATASTTYYAPAPGTTVYTTTAPGSTTTYTPAATTPPAGVQAFRDEYGFRYDGQGNRVDARGNIISPQSTQP
jgi:hypothetical protein